MAGQKPISVVIKGEYTDKDVKKAIADLRSLQSEAPAAATQFSGLGSTIAKLGGVLAATFTVSKVVDFFQESVKAAMEDEKSLVSLAKAMENVGLAQKNAAAEDLIKSMSLQFGIADDQLRPAFQRLVTATKDVGESQRLLQTAMDISAAGYTDLESAAKALSAASMGNFTALQRLKLPLDANTIASKDFEGAIAQLNQIVGGQAAAAANTYEGKLKKITNAANEAKETIGYALLKSLDDVSNSMGGTDGLVANIDAAGKAIGGLITGVSNLIRPVLGLFAAFGLVSDAGKTLVDKIVELGAKFGWILPGVGNLVNLLSTLSLYGQESATSMRGTSAASARMSAAAAAAVGPVDDMGGALDAAAAKAINAAIGIGTAADVFGAFKAQIASGQMGYADVAAMQQRMDKVAQSVKDRQTMVDRATAALNRVSSGTGPTGGAGKQAAEFVLLDAAMRRTLQTVNRTATSYDALTRSLGADDIAGFSRKMLAAGKITGDTKTEFEGLVSTIKGRLDKALADANDKLKEQKALWQGVYDTIAGGVMQGNGVADAAQQQADAAQALAEAQKAYDDAVAGGNSDEIAKTGSELEKAKGKQRTFLSFLQDGVNAAQSFSGQLKQITEVAGNTQEAMSLVSQIAQLGAKTGSRVAAELLAGGAAAIQNAVRMVGAVQAAANAAGVVAANTFYGAGVASAQAYVDALTTTVQPLLQSLLNSIAAQIAAALKQPVNADLGGGSSTPPSVPSSGIDWAGQVAAVSGVTNDAISDADFNQAFDRLNAWANGTWTPMATGGIVTAPTPVIAGEAGPEAIIPLSRVPQMMNGGNSYQITVQAGVGDPRAIGQQIVEAITRFERANGPVYARA